MKRRRFNDLSFEVPTAWVDTSVVTLVGRDSKRFAPSIVITREPSTGAKLEELANGQLAEIKRAAKNHELVSQRAETIAGQTGYVLEHRYLTPERVTVRQLQYFLINGDEVVVVSLTCAEQEATARATQLAEIAASLEITS